MIMRILLIFIFIFTVFSCNVNKNIGLMKIIKMNEIQFQKLSEISVDNESGFKFIKTTLEKNRFSSISTTNQTQIVTDDDYKKIKSILKKYK